MTVSDTGPGPREPLCQTFAIHRAVFRFPGERTAGQFPADGQEYIFLPCVFLRSLQTYHPETRMAVSGVYGAPRRVMIA